jgi:pimeloyl-ACP methyl ester carboxylesterase
VASCNAAATQISRALPATSGFITNGDVRLAYQLDLPDRPGPLPAVVLGHGSGRTTRHDLTWASSQWTRLGFAVLRFDKRGAGESSGTYTNVGTANSEAAFPLLASDIAAAVRFLRAQPGIDARRVGLSGNSQAGWILPIAAKALGDVPFMVLLAGPVCTVGVENFYSDIVEHGGKPIEEAYRLLPSFNGPHGFDPVPTLQTINTPTLWLLGDDDRSIPIVTTVENLERLKASGKAFEWKVYPGLGHSLSPVVWADIAAWVALR